MISRKTLNMTITGLRQHYLHKDFTPAQLIEFLLEESANEQSNPVWIHLLDAEEIKPFLEALRGKSPNDLPLYGIPFAIKDNIDLVGIPTTAACPDFSYTPDDSAFVVQQLINAGAIPLGKTNMDQFATGLVGTRSPEPWGPCKNALNETIISGGSSAGSAVAVAKTWVSFSLGTDTAGSGRVPASLNNIVGLKPSRGLLSNRGVVPACKSLDCVSVFALNTHDANTVFDVAAKFDSEDPYSRRNSYANGSRYFTEHVPNFRVGVPAVSDLAFFDNEEAQSLFADAKRAIKNAGGKFIEIDFSPFKEAARLLYEGPWVSERFLAIKALLQKSPDSILPVIKTIVGKGEAITAPDTYSAFYQLQAYYQKALAEFKKVDCIVTPTNGTYYSIAEVLDDPIQLNSNMGYYTNFMNLLDCAGIAVPTGFYKNKVGFGVTLFHRAMTDKRLLSIAANIEDQLQLNSGALDRRLSSNKSTTPFVKAPYASIPVVVCGAHLEGLPLNWQLKERGATFIESTTTYPAYRFYALAGGPPFRPGLIRDEQSGAAIDVEVWSVPREEFGSFVAEIPQPLGIGKVQLADGRWESGFICEPCGLEGAKEITELKSWKHYIAQGS
ncbi:allophanate hydrolase [Aurantivibrio infirmus]